MFLQLCCKVQFKDPQVLRYKCNIAVRYLKPGYALVQHTGLWCTVRQDQKQHKRSSSSVSEIGSLQCKTLHGSWFTITELVNMEVDGHRLKKARDQAHYRCKNQTLAVRSLAQTAHCTWISWSDSREHCPYSLLCTTPPQLFVKLQAHRLSSNWEMILSFLSLSHTYKICNMDWEHVKVIGTSPDETSGRCPKETIKN